MRSGLIAALAVIAALADFGVGKASIAKDRTSVASTLLHMTATAETTQLEAQNVPLEQLEASISQRQPLDYYVLALRLFEAGEKERATFWYYAGQLRWRVRLSCVEGIAPDGEQALFSSMNYQVGDTVNRYIGGYPSRWSKIIRDVAKWDENAANTYDYGQNCAAQNAEQRQGMLGLADNIDRNRDKLMQSRAQNGLPNHEQ
ncbi:hypothetical protein [Alterisphingorhabdus coralli]|uniref:Uncharacterized protein n=1 Tax=Alterisphingorhabdus coralli TaxID=3071408 RepID=A0AA97I2B2_9SPHN|nr:hypothetical protein [Parasphingorhabdus sp. SCSIO 66989]WOE75605.1 hypothetical protein RB602_02515 [Parasphingorhabdus sp. SCSIO 66989]